MPQLEFTQPDFMDGCSAEDIHERMMANLPDDIDSTPGGFPICTNFRKIDKVAVWGFYVFQ